MARKHPRQTTFFKCDKCGTVAEWANMAKLNNNYRWKVVLACPKCRSIQIRRAYDGESKTELYIL